jgi:hypothetical protein
MHAYMNHEHEGKKGQIFEELTETFSLSLPAWRFLSLSLSETNTPELHEPLDRPCATNE